MHANVRLLLLSTLLGGACERAPTTLLADGAPEPSGSPGGSERASAAPSRVRSAPPVDPLMAPCSQVGPEREGTSVERRVFRQLFVGALVNPPARITWVLCQARPSARLETFCQTASAPAAGMRLDGSEQAESAWAEPALSTYEGSSVRADGVGYRFSVVRRVGDMRAPACRLLPAEFVLQCRQGTVPVHEARAVLLPGSKRNDDTQRAAQWQPPTVERVDVLECTSDALAPALTWGRPLVFAPPRGGRLGIEFAFENSDMLVQDGGYRAMVHADGPGP